MKIGYARVSTEDQNMDLQVQALEAQGIKVIFKEYASGAKADRVKLREALNFVRDHEGDVLVVWKLDRLGRSLNDLIGIVQGLAARGIGFQSITEQIDTTTPNGKLIFHIFGAMAEFERDLIRERTLAGLAAARARGRKGGRPLKTLAPKKEVAARTMLANREVPISQIMDFTGWSRATVYRKLGRKHPERP